MQVSIGYGIIENKNRVKKNMVNIGHCIIENENRVTGRSKIPQECKNGEFWATRDTYLLQHFL
jgi:hypothetical protein